MVQWSKHWEELKPQLKYDLIKKGVLLVAASGALVLAVLVALTERLHLGGVTATAVIFGCSMLVFIAALIVTRTHTAPQLVPQQGTQLVSHVPAKLPQGLQEIEDLYQSIDPRYRSEVEMASRESLKVVPGDKLVEFLIHTNVLWIITYQLDSVWQSIFKSQIDALQALNSQSMKRVDLEGFYLEGAAGNPGFYSAWSFDQWIGYMRGMILILEEADNVHITVKGRQFLRYLIDGSFSVSSRMP